VARQIADYLLSGAAKNAVNMPSIDGDAMAKLGPYLKLCEKLGKFLGQLVKGGLGSVEISYRGDVSRYDCSPLTIATLVGLLAPQLKDMVNFVNAPHIAKERDITVSETKSDSAENFLDLISIQVKTDDGEWFIAGTLFGKKEPRIVRIGQFHLEAAPEGHLAFIKSVDAPGVIGEIGLFLGKNDININRMNVGQDLVNKLNLVLINTDVAVPGPVMDGLQNLSNVITAVRFEM
jgi:D-3-phosphoglycerate dehydrogenase